MKLLRLNSKGFTLIEILVAVLIGVNVLAAAGTALTWCVRYFRAVSERRQGTDQALMALRMVEKYLFLVSCRDNAACGADASSVVGSPSVGGTGDFLSGRIDDDDINTPTFFGFEYNAPTAPGTLTYCTATAMPASCSDVAVTSTLVIARNIMNGGADMFYRNIAPTPTTIRVLVIVKEGDEGGAPRNRTYQSTFTIAYSNP